MEAALPYIIGGLVSAVATSVLSPSPSGPGDITTNVAAAAAPKVLPVTPMPTTDDAAVQAAKKKSIADQIASQGRASTILTSDTLG